MPSFFEKLSKFRPFVKSEKENNLVETPEKVSEHVKEINRESDKERKTKKNLSDAKKKHSNEKVNVNEENTNINNTDTNSTTNNNNDNSNNNNNNNNNRNEENNMTEETTTTDTNKSTDKKRKRIEKTIDSENDSEADHRSNKSEISERHASNRKQNKSKEDTIVLYEYIFYVESDMEDYESILMNHYLKNTMCKHVKIKNFENYSAINEIKDSISNTRITRNSKKRRNSIPMSTDEHMKIHDIGTSEAFLLDDILKKMRQEAKTNDKPSTESNDNMVSEDIVQIVDTYEIKKIKNSIHKFNEVFKSIEDIIINDSTMKDFIVIKFVKSKKKNKMKDEAL